MLSDFCWEWPFRGAGVSPAILRRSAGERESRRPFFHRDEWDDGSTRNATLSPWLPLDGCVRISGEIDMPSQYIPIIIFAALAAAFPAVTLVLFKFIRPTPAAVGAKLRPYECGVEAEGDTRGRYSVRFYIVAILFVIFDVETTFLFPWAVLFSTRDEGFRLPEIYALASMFVFLGILIIGYVWLYRKGALEWV
jgi:NADH-quinone oxidoreductase subunit A